MEKRKIILVTDITGWQGENVARHLLSDERFSVRCLTRKPACAQALKLQQLGAEIVSGSPEDIMSLSAAMTGAYGVFGITTAAYGTETEYRHGKNLVLAVAAARADFFIYSSQPAAGAISKGQYCLHHCDTKAAIQDYARTMKADSSFIHVPDTYDMFFQHSLRSNNNGTWSLQLPLEDVQYAALASEDLGGIVASMFAHPEVYKKRIVGAVGSYMTGDDYAAAMSKVLKLKIVYEPVSFEAYAAMFNQQQADAFAFQVLFGKNRQIDLIESHGLNTSMHTFENWLQKNRNAFLRSLAEEEITA